MRFTRSDHALTDLKTTTNINNNNNNKKQQQQFELPYSSHFALSSATFHFVASIHSSLHLFIMGIKGLSKLLADEAPDVRSRYRCC
jgi:hypothetical protein